MSKFSQSEALRALNSLKGANREHAISAHADNLRAVAWAYANNGGIKPTIQTTMVALHTTPKKGAPKLQVASVAHVIHDVLTYVLHAAPDIGARAESGNDIPTRTNLADAFADDMVKLFLCGVAYAAKAAKLAREAAKAEKEAEQAKQDAAAPATVESTPTDVGRLGLSALIDRVAPLMSDVDSATVEATMEALPRLKALALDWQAQAREEARALRAELATSAEEARALRAELEALQALQVSAPATRSRKRQAA